MAMPNTFLHSITPRKRFHFKRSSLFFLLLTIILHFLFFQSSILTKWSTQAAVAIPLLSHTEKNIQVSMRALPTPAPTTTIVKKEAPNKIEPTKQMKQVRQPNKVKAFNAELVPQELTSTLLTTEDIAFPPLPLEAELEAENGIKTATTEEKPEELSLRVLTSADMDLEIERITVNGNSQRGVGKIIWRADTKKYSLRIEAGLSMLITTLNLYHITSEGNLGAYGLLPTITTESRLARAATATHFNYDQNIVSFSASTKKIPLEIGAQDKASVLMQLAAVGNADSKQLTVGKELSVQVAEEKEASIFQFTVVGEEEIDSPLAHNAEKLLTIHLVRPPKPGSYNSKLDIWFAPSQGWYPVQIRNTESNGTITTQKVSHIQNNIR